MDFTKEEYELQFYGFTIEQFKIEIRLLIGHIVNNLTEILANSVIEQLESIRKEESNVILSKISNVSDKIIKQFDEPFKEIDVLAEKYFSIPDNVLLVEDSIHAKCYTEADEAEYEEELNELIKAYVMNSNTKSKLLEEISKLEKLEEIVKIENDLIEKVENCLKINYNLPEIKSVVENLERIQKNN